MATVVSITKAILRSEDELETGLTAIPDPEPSPTLEARVAALEADAEQAALDRSALTLLLTEEETV